MADDSEKKQELMIEDPLRPVIPLRFPLTIEGKKIDNIQLDLMKLNGGVVSAARKRYEAAGNVLVIGPLSLDFCAYAAVDAAGLPYETISALIGPDYYRVTGAVRDFLIETGLDQEKA